MFRTLIESLRGTDAYPFMAASLQQLCKLAADPDSPTWPLVSKLLAKLVNPSGEVGTVRERVGNGHRQQKRSWPKRTRIAWCTRARLMRCCACLRGYTAPPCSLLRSSVLLQVDTRVQLLQQTQRADELQESLTKTESAARAAEARLRKILEKAEAKVRRLPCLSLPSSLPLPPPSIHSLLSCASKLGASYTGNDGLVSFSGLS